jgi:hypothetical protein
VPVADAAEAVALTADGSTAWVAERDGRVVPVVLASGRTGRPVTVGGRPSDLAVSGR